MKRTLLYCWIAAHVCVAPLVLQGQGRTIPEKLAAGGISLGGLEGVPSGPAPSIVKILEVTDVILRGVVRPIDTRMSEDQREVLTEYRISEPVVLYDRASILALVDTHPPLSVAIAGGTLTFDKLTYSQHSQALPLLDANSEYLLLLKRNGDEYSIAGRWYGAFRIAEGQVIPATGKRSFATELRNTPIETVIAQLLAHVRGQQ